ncbi:MAG TPA: phosphoglycerate kinase [Patescibacteria group bacterium]|jgi:phosphoglycerate kinase|nr:phosphoglycerate kinase [Patescibacteria group bacterium]
MAYKYLKPADIEGKSVLLRVDLNEEVDENGRLMDNFRVQSIVPTIQFLRKHNAKVVVLSHAGRPEGKWNENMSLKPMAQCLAELLKIKFVETVDEEVTYPIEHLVFIKGDIQKQDVQGAVQNMSAKDIVMLENLRFYPGEDANDPEFAKVLCTLGDVYVDDAFAVTHRAAASIVAITKCMPSFVGPSLEIEIKNLDYVTTKAQKPFVLMMGGIKISDKAKLLEKMGRQADKILVGGGLANVFMAAEGLEVGESVVEKESQNLAWSIMQNFKDKLVLPKDFAVFDTNNPKETAIVKDRFDIGKTEKICDIGPKTILEYAKVLKTAKTICWNGPVGYFEKKPFRTGTMALAKIVGSVGKGSAFVVVGGGETVAAVRQAHQFEYYDHVSTGGGAMLEYLSGNKLPGIEALKV